MAPRARSTTRRSLEQAEHRTTRRVISLNQSACAWRAPPDVLVGLLTHLPDQDRRAAMSSAYPLVQRGDISVVVNELLVMNCHPLAKVVPRQRWVHPLVRRSLPFDLGP